MLDNVQKTEKYFSNKTATIQLHNFVKFLDKIKLTIKKSIILTINTPEKEVKRLHLKRNISIIEFYIISLLSLFRTIIYLYECLHVCAPYVCNAQRGQ